MRRLSFFLVVGCLACAGPASIRVHMENGERHVNDADASLDEAEKAMQALEPDAAAQKLERAKKALSDPDVEYYPERRFGRERLAADEVKLVQVRKEREQRDLDAAVAAQWNLLEKQVPVVDTALEGIRPAVLNPDSLRAAHDAASELQSDLKKGRPLEAKDTRYGAFAQKLQSHLDHAEQELSLAKKKLEFLEGPVVVHSDAEALLQRAAARPTGRSDLYSDALAKLQLCLGDGNQLLRSSPELVKAELRVRGHRTTPGLMTSLWGAQARTVQRKLAMARRQETALERRSHRKKKGQRS